MKDPVYRLIELSGTSTTSLEDAMVGVIQYAYESIKSLCWFQVDEPRGEYHQGILDRWHVTVRVGYTIGS